MSDDSLSLGSMNWRLVEDAKEAMSRGDWMLALSLFEQSRRICINEGWREGVHYADDMILNVYPMVKRQIDEGNRIVEEANLRAISQPDAVEKGDVDQDDRYGYASTNRPSSNKDTFDDSASSRRLRRMIGDGKGTSD